VVRAGGDDRLGEDLAVAAVEDEVAAAGVEEDPAGRVDDAGDRGLDPEQGLRRACVDDGEAGAGLGDALGDDRLAEGDLVAGADQGALDELVGAWIEVYGLATGDLAGEAEIGDDFIDEGGAEALA
jgi:hypothetical protein